MQLKTGDRIGDYEVLGVLGAGGMGSVYKVRNTISDRVEAIKLLLPNLVEHPDLKARFLREIKTSASLEHPCIAGLRTAFQSGDMLLMVMEFVDGQTLDSRLRQGPLSVEEAVRITASVLEALEYAHSRGVVHRDIKPANVMLAARGGVKLLDFGIARATTDQQITVAGTTMGSLYYMSPEQIRGEQVDARADLYSLGITLYELTTGKRPFGGESGYAIMAEHLQKQPVPPVEIAPALPPALSAVILRALAKQPDDRYQSAAQFRQDLLSVVSPEEATQIISAAASPNGASTAPAQPVPPAMQAPSDAITRPPAPPMFAPPMASQHAQAGQPEVAAPLPPQSEAAAPAFMPPSRLGGTPPATKKPSSALALVMVALIAFLVLSAVVVVFAGSWFFGSAETTVASATPGLMERIAGMFSGSSDGSADADRDKADTEGDDAENWEQAEKELEAAIAALDRNPSDTASDTPAPTQLASNRSAPGQAVSSGAPDANAGRQAAGAASRAASVATGAAQSATRVQQGYADSPQSYGSVAPPAAQAPVAPSAPEGPSPQDLEDARDFFSKLGIRAGTIQESARKLSQEQSSLGVSLRADMRASLKRMEYLMDQAEVALGRGNLVQAKQQMQGAEREIEKLEKFFRI